MSYRLERARLDEATANKIRSLEQELQCQVVALEAKVQFAELSHDQFVRLERIEKELGVSLVAYRATDYYQIASVPVETLERVQQLERDTGLVFVAYQHVREEPVRAFFRPEDGCSVAELSEDQAERLYQSECDSNLLLMAYKKS